jgi:FdrA protein
MGTPLNLDVLDAMGLPAPQDAGPNDLVVVVEAQDAQHLDAALQRLEQLLAARAARTSTGPGTEAPPRTVGAALARDGAGSALVLVSVPGDAAYAEARDAIESGCSVMIFSDNVSLDQEIALKDLAAEQDVLVMGPDCGTAVVGGLGLGFANVVRPGPVSIVAASGTGAQQVMALLDAAGVGVRHCLGLGGRDLGAAVRGRSARQALIALDADPQTERILLVSKPPDPAVLRDLRELAEGLPTPVDWAALGPDADDLSTSVAATVERVLRRPAPSWPQWRPDRPLEPRPGLALRGLFCGGTLCDEAMVVAGRLLGPIRSNVPLRPEWDLEVSGQGWDAGTDHAMVDLGDDTFTVGRAHPMIDPSLRLDRLADELADARVGVVLLDVVLGHGAHPDPSSDLATVLASAGTASGRGPAVVVSLTGTAGDPQGRPGQAEALRAAGAHVHLSNAEAARHAAELVAERADD